MVEEVAARRCLGREMMMQGSGGSVRMLKFPRRPSHRLRSAGTPSRYRRVVGKAVVGEKQSHSPCKDVDVDVDVDVGVEDLAGCLRLQYSSSPPAEVAAMEAVQCNAMQATQR